MSVAKYIKFKPIPDGFAMFMDDTKERIEFIRNPMGFYYKISYGNDKDNLNISYRYLYIMSVPAFHTAVTQMFHMWECHLISDKHKETNYPLPCRLKQWYINSYKRKLAGKFFTIMGERIGRYIPEKNLRVGKQLYSTLGPRAVQSIGLSSLHNVISKIGHERFLRENAWCYILRDLTEYKTYENLISTIPDNRRDAFNKTISNLPKRLSTGIVPKIIRAYRISPGLSVPVTNRAAIEIIADIPTSSMELCNEVANLDMRKFKRELKQLNEYLENSPVRMASKHDITKISALIMRARLVYDCPVLEAVRKYVVYKHYNLVRTIS